MSPIKTFKGPFTTAQDLRTIQNEINKLFNDYTKNTGLFTIGVQTIYADSSFKTTYVDIPKTKINKIKVIRIFKLTQTPTAL